MNSKEYFICVCKCERRGMDKIHFNIYNKDKHCEQCGGKYKLIPAPILGVLVHSEGACSEYENEWISITELIAALRGDWRKGNE